MAANGSMGSNNDSRSLFCAAQKLHNEIRIVHKTPSRFLSLVSYVALQPIKLKQWK